MSHALRSLSASVPVLPPPTWSSLFCPLIMQAAPGSPLPRSPPRIFESALPYLEVGPVTWNQVVELTERRLRYLGISYGDIRYDGHEHVLTSMQNRIFPQSPSLIISLTTNETFGRLFSILQDLPGAIARSRRAAAESPSAMSVPSSSFPHPPQPLPHIAPTSSAPLPLQPRGPPHARTAPAASPAAPPAAPASPQAPPLPASPQASPLPAVPASPQAPPLPANPLALLPDSQEVLTAQFPYMRHLSLAREEIGNEFELTLGGVARANATANWTLLFMFPACILVRTNFPTRQQAVDDLRRRLRLWHAGSYREVWDDVQQWRLQPRDQVPDRANVERKVAKIMALCADNSAGKAYRLLTSGAVPASMSDAVREEMEAKHPRNPDAMPDLAENLPALPTFSRKEIRRALFQMKKGTSAGLSGFSVAHLRDLWSLGNLSHLRDYFIIVINNIVNGRIPDEIAPLLTGARLIPLRKPNTSSLRPIAIGETLIRLAGRLASGSVRRDARRLLSPTQVGVATNGGTEAVVEVSSTWLQDVSNNRNIHILLLDFVNAFNQAERSTMLQVIQQHFPQLARFAWLCYRVPSFLWLHDQNIESQQGTRQGDPLASLFFDLVLRELTTALEERFGDQLMQVWYQDDGTLRFNTNGELSIPDLLEFVREHSRTARLGLHLGPKCKWITHIDNFPHVLGECIRLEREFRDHDASSTFQLQPQIPGQQVVLGVPLGTDDFVSNWLSRKFLHLIQHDIPLLRDFPDPQCAFYMIRFCLIPKVNHWARSVPPRLFSAALLPFHTALQECIAEILGGLDLSEEQLSSFWLPTRVGLGFQNFVILAPIARLASLQDSRDLVSDILRNQGWSSPELNGLVAEVAELVGRPPERPPDGRERRQKLYTDWYYEQFINTTYLGEDDDVDPALRARFLSSSGPYAAAFLQCPPNPHHGLKMSPQEFTTSCKLRIGANITSPEQALCPNCALEADRAGYHFLQCSHGRDGTHGRHRGLIDAIVLVCRYLGLRHRLEHRLPGSARRPGDIVIYGLMPGVEVWVDVGVTNPVAVSYRRRAASAQGVRAGDYAGRKLASYYRQFEQALQQTAFCPAIWEVFGLTGDAINIPPALADLPPLTHRPFGARTLIRKLAHHMAHNTDYGVPIAHCIHHIACRFSVALQRGNARAVLNRLRTDGSYDLDFAAEPDW